MPVVVEFQPTAAIGQLAGQEGNNRNFVESQELGKQNIQLQEQVQDDQLRRQQVQQDMAAQQQRMQIQGAEQQAQQQPPGAPAGVATLPFTGPDGNTYRVSPQQKVALTNLANTTKDVGAFTAGAKQLLGTPGLVPVANPDGSKSYVTPEQAAMMGYHQAALGNQEKRTQIYADHIGSVDQDRDAKLQLDRDKLTQAADAMLDKKTAASVKGALATAQVTVNNAHREVEFAKDGLDEAIKTAQNLPADPQEDSPDQHAARASVQEWKGRLTTAIQKAQAAEQSQAQSHARARQMLLPNSGGGQGGSQFTHTATGPNGQRLGWNGSQWVQFQ